MFPDNKLSSRNGVLATGVFAMLFSGILYAWSILKVPFKTDFGFSDSSLAFNFTLTMCFFCIGAFLGGRLFKIIGTKRTIILAGILVGIGFFCTGLIANTVVLLYIFYAAFAGLGIGIAYNVILSTVSAWFPDKKGFCSGMLMMAFGASTLILGKVIETLFAAKAVGWQKTFMIFGVTLAFVLIFTGLILKTPSNEVVFPVEKIRKKAIKECFEARDYSTAEMVRRFSFWRALICLVFLTAVGNSVISFARDLVISVGAEASLATTLVGVLSICNGLGRIFAGALFDMKGRRATMLAANIITIFAAGVTLIAVTIGSLPLCITGLCLTGLSYGSCPTVCSAFTAAFYGQKHFPSNFSITNFNLLGAAFIATLSSNLFLSTNSYVAPFAMLLVLSVAALGLNLSIRKP
ncbi:MAG: MFS transporter [Clostridia bacterium]|nr:MFS transporter [Clostridia bacterium]